MRAGDIGPQIFKPEIIIKGIIFPVSYLMEKGQINLKAITALESSERGE